MSVRGLGTQIQLIPLNFFLHWMLRTQFGFCCGRPFSRAHLVPYDADFAKLALFAFHLAASGNWRHSKWPDGKVAGWANEFIRTVAWRDGQWSGAAFTERTLTSFVDERIDGEAVTKRKVLTNYRYMIASAGVLVDGQIPKTDLRARWLTDATQLFWDRQNFSQGSCAVLAMRRISKQHSFGMKSTSYWDAPRRKAERSRSRAIYRDYSERILPTRIEQLEKLRTLLAA